MGYSCIVRTCDKEKNRRMHRAPLKNPKIAEQWMKNVDRMDLMGKNLQNYAICDIHFCDKQKFHTPNLNRTNLIRGAVPCVYLPGQINPGICTLHTDKEASTNNSNNTQTTTSNRGQKQPVVCYNVQEIASTNIKEDIGVSQQEQNHPQTVNNPQEISNLTEDAYYIALDDLNDGNENPQICFHTIETASVDLRDKIFILVPKDEKKKDSKSEQLVVPSMYLNDLIEKEVVKERKIEIYKKFLKNFHEIQTLQEVEALEKILTPLESTLETIRKDKNFHKVKKLKSNVN